MKKIDNKNNYEKKIESSTLKKKLYFNDINDVDFIIYKGKEYLLNFFRVSKYRDKYLVTVDTGSFVLLLVEEFKELKRKKITSSKLFDKLKKNFIILDLDNTNAFIEKLGIRYSFLLQGPSLMIIVPTMRCNLRCTYCFANSNYIEEHYSQQVSDMDKDTAKKVVDFLFKSPNKALTIEFQGGECTLKYDIMKFIIKYAKELNKKYKKDLRITLVSNLKEISDEQIDFFGRENVSICTSIDGPKKVHNINRFYLKDGHKIGSYDEVIENVHRINKYYEEHNISMKVKALPTITEYSLKYWKEIIDLYVDLGIEVYDIRFLNQIGRAKNWDIRKYIKEFLDFREKSIDYLNELNKDKFRILERFTLLFYIKIVQQTPAFHADYESPCGAVTGQLLFYPNGDIFSCNEGMLNDVFKIGNVFENSWKEVFTNENTSSLILSTMLESNPICDTCAYKPYCGTCIVQNYSLFNKFGFYPFNTKRHYLTKKISDEILRYYHEDNGKEKSNFINDVNVFNNNNNNFKSNDNDDTKDNYNSENEK